MTSVRICRTWTNKFRAILVYQALFYTVGTDVFLVHEERQQAGKPVKKAGLFQ